MIGVATGPVATQTGTTLEKICQLLPSLQGFTRVPGPGETASRVAEQVLARSGCDDQLKNLLEIEAGPEYSDRVQRLTDCIERVWARS